MGYPTRINYTETDKRLMWECWQKGESLNEIGRRFGRSHTSIQSILGRTGGIRPQQRKRAARSLSLAEREEISRGIVAGRSMRSIAAELGRAPSTISREISRNEGRRCYRATTADTSAWERARRLQSCKLVENPALARLVTLKLQLEWSPEQIAGWLKQAYPHDELFQVSQHETIYKSLYIQARGALKRELLQSLRRTRGMRRSRHHTQKTSNHGRILDTVSISERPAEIEDRAVPGHWEGDLISGSNNSHIATLVERQTRYVMLVKVGSKDTETVITALIKQAHNLPREVYKSLTWDRGKELAAHRRFSLATDIDVFFCDPQSPWQRGSNENTNGLLRQYFPKGMDLSDIHQNRLNAVARRLNERPRKTLCFRTPAACFNECVASTT
ncbi:MAG: IS30 family transposase [Haliea sp.]